MPFVSSRKSIQMPLRSAGNEVPVFMLRQPLSSVSRNRCSEEDSTFLRAAYLSVAARHMGTPQELIESRFTEKGHRKASGSYFPCLDQWRQLNSIKLWSPIVLETFGCETRFIELVHYCSKVVFLEKLIVLFIKDPLNGSELSVKTFIMLQKVYFTNKCCSF